MRIAMCLTKGRDTMSYEIDRDRIDQIIVLGGLVLFIVLTVMIPA